MIINELLAYAMHFVNTSAYDNVKRIIQSFYSSSEIITAKKALWEACGDVLGKLPERKSTDKRPGSVAHIIDILDALKSLDALEKLPDVVARNLDRLPDRQPEELNLLMIVQRVAALEKSSEQHSDALSSIAVDVLNLKESRHRSFSDALISGRPAIHEDSNVNTAIQTDEEAATPSEVASQSTQDDAVVNRQSKTVLNHSMSVAVPSSSRRLPSHHRNQTRPDASKYAGRRNETRLRASEVNAGRTRQVQPDKDGFVPVMSRRGRRVIGCGKASVSGFEGAPPPLRHIWVSRVHRGTAETLSTFIEKQQVKVFYNEKVSHENAKFSSFKIGISKNDLAKVLDDSFWPQGVQCQPWRDRARRSDARTFNSDGDNQSSSSRMDYSDLTNDIPTIIQESVSVSGGADNARNFPRGTLDNTV